MERMLGEKVVVTSALRGSGFCVAGRGRGITEDYLAK
jgi:hypothetical protein